MLPYDSTEFKWSLLITYRFYVTWHIMVFGDFEPVPSSCHTAHTTEISLSISVPWVSIEIISLGTGLDLLKRIIMYNGNDSISRPIGFHDHNRIRRGPSGPQRRNGSIVKW